MNYIGLFDYIGKVIVRPITVILRSHVFSAKSAVVVCALLLLPYSDAKASGEQWSFELSPYIWMSGVSGSMATIRGSDPADVDLSFGDVLENLDFAGFVTGSARRGRWSILGDISYSLSSEKEDTTGPVFSSVKVKNKTLVGTMAGAYAISQSDTGVLDIAAGFRLWSVGSDFILLSGISDEQRVAESETWVSPIIGLSGRERISGNWSLFGAATVGGFGVGSDVEIGLVGGLRYDLGSNWQINLAYRHLYVDYENDGFKHEIVQTGPIIGVSLSW